MSVMLCLTVGATGFFSVVLYDLAQIRGKAGAASVLSSIGYLCILASIVFLMLSTQLPATPFGLLLIKGFLTSAFLLLLIYSVLIEIPVALRRRSRGRSDERAVVDSGFYGVVRHPGFVWFALLWASIVATYLDPRVTAVGTALVIIDFALVVLEDLVFFPRIFPNYSEYKKQVPFIIPRLRRR